MARGPQDVIRELREGLENDEIEYRRALALVEDPEKALKFLNGLKTKLLPLMLYDADTQPPHSAVFVVASMQERLGGVFQDLQFIEDYEERKREYKAHVKAHVGIDDEQDHPGEGSEE
jgi:hypothetical protein